MIQVTHENGSRGYVDAMRIVRILERDPVAGDRPSGTVIILESGEHLVVRDDIELILSRIDGAL